MPGAFDNGQFYLRLEGGGALSPAREGLTARRFPWHYGKIIRRCRLPDPVIFDYFTSAAGPSGDGISEALDEMELYTESILDPI